MMSAFNSARLFVLLSVAAFAQNPPKFEVASVRQVPSRPPIIRGPGERGEAGAGGCATSFKMDRARVDIKCATLRMLIGYAFQISPDRVTGLDWMMGLTAPKFDIAANIPPGASEYQVSEMLRELLNDRFHLAIHRESRTQAIYAVVVAKGGLKLNAATPEATAPIPDADAPPSIDEFFGAVHTRTIPSADGSGSTTTLSNPRMGTVRETDGTNRTQRWEAPSTTLEGLADLLDKVAPLPSPIVDGTGLKGRYQMVLEVSLNDLSAAGNARMDMEEIVLKAFNDGLRKLGLQLEHRKGPLDTLIVDHADKTPTEN